MTNAIITMLVLGAAMGLVLYVASVAFYVPVDERVEKTTSMLPGYNCGGCGYAGCSGLAAAIVKGEAPVNQCPVGGDEVAAKIGEIMGVAAEAGVKKVAFVKCAGTCYTAKVDYEYTGIEDCAAMAFVPNGGAKSCKYGCLGFGTCVKACPFDAIHIVDGVAVVDKDACKACGKCIAACPKNLIELVPYAQTHLVQCSSKDKGKQVMSVCKAGCIGCKMCEKVCPSEAITVTDNLAHIDPEKCTNCGLCAEKCPKKIIL